MADLEDELIRSLGVASVEQVIEGQGELGSLRTLQKQPAHRGEPATEQLRRFMGTRSGRKSLYARLLTEALDSGPGAAAAGTPPGSRLSNPRSRANARAGVPAGTSR